MEEELILLMAALLLAGGSTVLVFLRWRHRADDWPLERQWQGHGIDVTRMSARVQRVRNDYLAESPRRASDDCRRARMVGSARRAIKVLRYFQRRLAASEPASGSESETHAGRDKKG